MNEAKKRYRRKCTTKIITFYPNEKDLWEYCKRINFQGTIKTLLRSRMESDEFDEGITETEQTELYERNN